MRKYVLTLRCDGQIWLFCLSSLCFVLVCSHNDCPQVIKYLLEKRANPVLRNLNGAMPFHLAEHMVCCCSIVYDVPPALISQSNACKITNRDCFVKGHDEEICKLIDPQKFKDMLKEVSACRVYSI